MSYTFAAFIADAVGSAYIVLLVAWVCKVRVDGDPLGPLQALSRTSGRGVLWIVGGGLAFAAAVGHRDGVVAGIAIGVGGALACVVIAVGRDVLGPDYRPYAPERGWSAVLQWTMWLGLVVLGMLGFGVFGGFSAAAGGILNS